MLKLQTKTKDFFIMNSWSALRSKFFRDQKDLQCFEAVTYTYIYTDVDMSLRTYVHMTYVICHTLSLESLDQPPQFNVKLP